MYHRNGFDKVGPSATMGLGETLDLASTRAWKLRTRYIVTCWLRASSGVHVFAEHPHHFVPPTCDA